MAATQDEETGALREEIWNVKQTLSETEKELADVKKKLSAAGKKLQAAMHQLEKEKEALAAEKERAAAARKECEELADRVMNGEALAMCYRRSLRVVDEIRSMKFARAYAAVSRRAGKGDPFDSVRPELPNFSGIDVHIESRRYLHGCILIRGWAADRESPGEYLEVLDAAGRHVDASVSRHVRADVNDSLHMDSARKAGFEIRIDGSEPEGLPYTLLCESPRGYVSCPLRLEADQNRRVERWRQVLSGKAKADPGEFLAYNDWAAMNRISREELEAEASERFRGEILFSIAIPVFNTPPVYLEAVLDSILNQTYRNLEVCLADASNTDEQEKLIRARCGPDPRIRYRRLARNGGISENTNEAIAMAGGDYLILADHDDLLEPHALFRIAEKLREEPDADIVYTDEDKVTEDGTFLFDPFMKPDYDPYLLESYNYFTHLVAVRRTLALEAGLLDASFDGAQDYDFFLRCSERAAHTAHVPEILYHWRAHESSTAGNPESKLYAYENGRKAVEAHLKRLGRSGRVQMTPWWGRYRIRYDVPEEPCVSVLLWGEGDMAGAFLEKNRLPWVREVLETQPGEKAPESLNRLAGRAEGSFLLFWCRDTAPREGEAVRELLGILSQTGAAAAGTKISDPAGRLYHAGMTVREDGSCGCLLNGISRDVFAYGGSANLVHQAAAFTADFLMVRKEAFDEAGGFRELPGTSLFDADLCLRLREKGGQAVFTPYAEAVSARGDAEEWLKKQEKMNDGQDGRKGFAEIWKGRFRDPFYPPLLDPVRLDYSLKGQYGP